MIASVCYGSKTPDQAISRELPLRVESTHSQFVIEPVASPVRTQAPSTPDNRTPPATERKRTPPSNECRQSNPSTQTRLSTLNTNPLERPTRLQNMPVPRTHPTPLTSKSIAKPQVNPPDILQRYHNTPIRQIQTYQSSPNTFPKKSPKLFPRLSIAIRGNLFARVVSLSSFVKGAARCLKTIALI